MLKADFARVAKALRSEGLLLAHDSQLPSVTKIMVGPIRGSWWGHRDGARIYAVMNALEAEYLSVKLVRDKITYVDTALLPVFLAAAEADDPWQTQALAPSARTLLDKVRAQGRMLLGVSQTEGAQTRADARKLQQRLLVLATSEHTASGAHYPLLETWAHFRRRSGCATTLALSGPQARAQLQAVVARWVPSKAGQLLPWGRIDPLETP
jgi:hypothetical protein